MAKQVTRWEASNGSIWATEEEADAWDHLLIAERCYRDNPIFTNGVQTISHDELVRWVRERAHLDSGVFLHLVTVFEAERKKAKK